MGLSDTPAIAFEDDLTGLFNRRYFERYLATQIDWKNPARSRFSLVLIDLDAFHRANDKYGHDEGDFVLQSFAERLRRYAREDDVLARDSGDSFLILMPSVTKAEAASVASIIVEDVAKSPLKTRRDRFPVELTASAGVVSFPEDGSDLATLRAALEKVLFHAKRSGRNRVSQGGAIDENLAAEREVFGGLPCRTFCGRLQELPAALSLLQDMVSGRPATLFVHGPPGIGKSRFLRQIAEAATLQKTLYLHVLCNESQRQSVGHSLVYLIDQYFRITPGTIPALRELLTPPQRKLARELIAPLAVWPFENVDIAPRDRKGVLLDMLETALLTVARQSPLLILLDNARHADRGTLDVLRRVLCEKRAPLAVAFALKGDVRELDPHQEPGLHDLVDELGRQDLLQTLSLAPLARTDVSAMIRSVLPDTEIPRPFEEILLAKSGGNPLYVEESIRFLLLEQRIVRQGSRYVIRDIADDDLPARLSEVIERVIDRLPPEAGELITNAAILGARFDVQVLQEVMGKREGETLDAVDRAADARLIEHLERGTGDDYAFNSNTARDVSFVLSPEETRKSLQRRIDTVEGQRSIPSPAGAWRPSMRRSAGASPPLAAPEAGVVGRPPRIPEAADPLDAESVRLAAGLMRNMTALLRIGRLYPQWSQMGIQFQKQLQEAAQALSKRTPAVTFTAEPKGLLINGRPPDGSMPADIAAEFCALLSGRLIFKLTLGAGLESREVDALVAALAMPMNRAQIAPDHWDSFLDRGGFTYIDILQRRYVAREADTTRIRALSEIKERPLTPDELDAARLSLRQFKAAAENLRLYPPGHSLVEEALRSTLKSLADFVGRVHVVVFATSEDGLIVNGQPLDARSIGDGGAFLSQQLLRRGLGALTLVRGLTTPEIQALVSLFAIPAEDPAWKAVARTLVTETEDPHFEFGNLVYAQLTAAIGGRLPPAAAPHAPKSTPPGSPAASPGIPGEEGAAVERIPTGHPVRADVRARAWLKAPAERLLSEEFERDFAPLLDVLNRGWAADLGAQLATRVLGLLRDTQAERRRRALAIIAGVLSATATPEGLALLAAPLPEPLGQLLTSELEVPVMVQAATTVLAAISAMLKIGRAEAAASILTSARRRIAAKTAPPAFKEALLGGLQKLAGPDSPVVSALRSPQSGIRAAVLKVAGLFGPSVIPHLVEAVETGPDPEHARLAALALKEVGGGADLTKRVSSAAPADRVRRVLDVLELSNPPSLVGPTIATLEHPDPEVRRALVSLLCRAERPLAAGALRKLITSDRPETAGTGIKLAAEIALGDVGLDVTRVAQNAEDPSLVRDCCEYFARVRVPAAIPALRRVFDARQKMFGLVKGFPDDVRALAVRAAAALPHPDAVAIVEEARRDKSPAVRRAAGEA